MAPACLLVGQASARNFSDAPQKPERRDSMPQSRSRTCKVRGGIIVRVVATQPLLRPKASSLFTSNILGAAQGHTRAHHGPVAP
jgi:hypothetical protein